MLSLAILAATIIVAGAVALAYRRMPAHLIYRSKLQLERMFDSINDPLAVISSAYVISRVNRAYAAMVSRTFNDIIGKTCYSVLRGRSSPCEDCKMPITLETATAAVTDRSPHPTNENGSVSLTFYPFGSRTKKCMVAVEHLRDITALEFLKTHLEEQNQVLVSTTRKLEEATAKTQEELALAGQLQLGMLPQRVPSIDGLNIAVTYHPIHAVGGDTYDFVTFSKKRLGVFIGDASGHGVASSLVGTVSKMSLFSHTRQELPPVELLNRMNRDLLVNIHSGHYLTCIWAVFDNSDNSLTWVRAGHPRPLLIRAEGTVEMLDSAGTLIGLIEDPVFEQQRHVLSQGDRLYLFTDGIYEVLSRGGVRSKLLGYNRFQDILVACNRLPFSEVIPAIQQHLAEYTYEDDYTLLLIESTRTASS